LRVTGEEPIEANGKRIGTATCWKEKSKEGLSLRSFETTALYTLVLSEEDTALSFFENAPYY